MRYLYKVVFAFLVVLLFVPLVRSQTTTRRTAQTHQRTLRPQPRYNAFHSHTFTGVLADVGIRVGTIMGWHQIVWSVTGTVTACQVQLDESSDGINWTASPPIFSSQTCTTNGHPSPQTVAKTTTFVRLNMTAFTGTGSVLVDYYGFTSNPGGGGGGGGPTPAPAYTINGNPTGTTADAIFFPPAGDISLGAGGFSVNALHFGPSNALGLSTTAPTSGQCLQYNGTSIVGGTCGGGGGGGNVTATPPLTSPFLPKATGPTTIADSRFSDTGTLGLYTGATFGVGAGDTSCGSTTGCIALAESAVTGGGTSIGHAYVRADAASHALKFANLAGEFFLPRMTNTGNAGQVAIANGDGTYTAADPLISVNSGLLFSNVSGISSQTGSMLNPLRSGYGTLSISPVGTFSTGTCSISLYFNTSTAGAPVGGNTNPIPFAVVNFQLNAGVPLQSIPIVPDPSVGAGAGGDYIVGVYNCSTFPGSGAGFSATISPGLTAGPPFTCNRKQLIDVNASGITQLIPLVSTARIYVCGWTVNTASNTALDVNLLQGNANCATNTPFSETIALQALTNSAPVGAVNNAPSNVVDATGYGQALCINLSAAPASHVFGKIWYAQF